MYATYVILGIMHETKDEHIDAFNIQEILTDTLFNYYGDEKACINGKIRIPTKEVSERQIDNNINDVGIFIDNIIKCDDEE